jgi:hypothetical protein
MRENRPSGSEGGATLIQSSLPLSFIRSLRDNKPPWKLSTKSKPPQSDGVLEYCANSENKPLAAGCIGQHIGLASKGLFDEAVIPGLRGHQSASAPEVA